MLNATNKISAISDVLKHLNIDHFDIVLEKQDIEGFTIKREGQRYIIYYKEKSDLIKALGLISINGDKISEITKKKTIKNLGYLVDTARNAVPTVKTLKQLLIRLATFGYNRLYFYCEDVMQIENEPFYGHLRGRYTFDEIREIDAYADELGIEVVPCIQTLAHLNCMFKWPEYAQCNDTADILLIDSDRTYKLINNIFSTINNCFKSKHVHIGMDEAYLVGRGKHMDLYGLEEKHVLLKRHIDIVMSIAEKYGFTTEIWSDMYFREAFGGGYYSATQGLSDEVCEEIPKNVGLVYWDYWNRDEQVIENMFVNHIKTGNEISFAGGACKWSGWNPSTEQALIVSRKMLDGCRRHNIQSVILTAWSDDGAEASVFTTLPSIILYSQFAYGEKNDDASIDEIIRRYSGISLDEYIVADLSFLDESGVDEPYLFGTLPKILLYNDVLSGFYDGILQKYDITERIARNKTELKKIADNCNGYEKSTFKILTLLCEVLEIKWNLGIRIRKAYQTNDIDTLRIIAEKDIPELINILSIFKSEFYKRWMNENKSNGLQTHDLRLGGLAERLNTVKQLIISYINSEIKEISELEEELLPVEHGHALDMLLWTTWNRIHSLYVI